MNPRISCVVDSLELDSAHIREPPSAVDARGRIRVSDPSAANVRARPRGLAASATDVRGRLGAGETLSRVPGSLRAAIDVFEGGGFEKLPVLIRRTFESRIRTPMFELDFESRIRAPRMFELDFERDQRDRPRMLNEIRVSLGAAESTVPRS